MITTSSKNNSFICAEALCDEQAMCCQECDAHTGQQVQPLKKFLYELWLDIRLFLGTDRWNGAVTLQRGDSHYTLKMEDIEVHWRNQ